MSPVDAADEIKKIIRRQLESCAAAIDASDLETAAAELEDGIRRLKKLARELD